MTDWQQARERVLGRLSQVRRLVDAKDESAVLALINEQDDFCEAARQRQAEQGGPAGESMCRYCEGFRQAGGCQEQLDKIDQAVLSGEWSEAARLVDQYAEQLRTLAVSPSGRQRPASNEE